MVAQVRDEGIRDRYRTGTVALRVAEHEVAGRLRQGFLDAQDLGIEIDPTPTKSGDLSRSQPAIGGEANPKSEIRPNGEPHWACAVPGCLELGLLYLSGKGFDILHRKGSDFWGARCPHPDSITWIREDDSGVDCQLEDT
jgi:hypothetical protein